MANMRAIRTRIKSVKNTEQITKAMKMVAVSKLRRTQSSMQAMRPFSEKSQEVMDTLLSASSGLENRFIKPHKEVKKVCYVLFLGNRGLCGAYNSAILHYANSVIKQAGKEYGLVVCGRWGKDVLANSKLNVIKTFAELSDTPNIDEALEVADYLKSLYTSGEYEQRADEDDEQSMFRDIFISCVLVDIPNVMNCSADSIQKGSTSANGIVPVGHRLHLLNRHTVMDNLAHVVKENGRDQCLAILFFLLFNHGVESSDGVCFQSAHRAAAIKDEYDLRQVLSHVLYLSI